MLLSLYIRSFLSLLLCLILLVPLFPGAQAADGGEKDGALGAFLELYARLSPKDKASIRDYMRKLLESGE